MNEYKQLVWQCVLKAEGTMCQQLGDNSITRGHSMKLFKERSRLNISKYLFLIVLSTAGTVYLSMSLMLNLLILSKIALIIIGRWQDMDTFKGPWPNWTNCLFLFFCIHANNNNNNNNNRETNYLCKFTILLTTNKLSRAITHASAIEIVTLEFEYRLYKKW